MVLREQILSMNPASLLFAAVFLIFILLAMINPTELNYLEMMWIPFALLIPKLN